MPKKKASGKKKSKKSKKDAALDKATEFFRPIPKTPDESLLDALKKLKWWIVEEMALIKEFFGQFEKDLLCVEEFVSALRYLQAPITSSQTTLLLKYLDDSHSGYVDKQKFQEIQEKNDRQLLEMSLTTSLADPVKEEEDDKGKKKKTKGKRMKKSAKDDSIPVKPAPDRYAEFEPRYIDLKLILATFKDFKKHPAHFTISTTTSTTIHGVSQLIQTHLDGTTTSVALFKDAACSKDSYMNPSWTLESCGVEGSNLQYQPTTYQLYYDYIPDFMGCPLLMTDLTMRADYS